MSDDVYPIGVRKQSGTARSSSGGKDYHLVLVTTKSGRSLLITRWARKDQWGNGFNVEQHATAVAAEQAYRDKRSQKLDREYRDIFINNEVVADDLNEFRRALGVQYWAKIGPSNLEFLIPGIDTTGMREVPVVRWGDDDVPYREPTRRMIPDELPKVEDRVAENSKWGMF